jgi:hypothetical protein
MILRLFAAVGITVILWVAWSWWRLETQRARERVAQW